MPTVINKSAELEDSFKRALELHVRRRRPPALHNPPPRTQTNPYPYHSHTSRSAPIPIQTSASVARRGLRLTSHDLCLRRMGQERVQRADKTAKSELEQWTRDAKSKMPPSSTFEGKVINYSYSDAKKIRKHLLSTTDYTSKKQGSGEQFVLAVSLATIATFIHMKSAVAHSCLLVLVGALQAACSSWRAAQLPALTVDYAHTIALWCSKGEMLWIPWWHCLRVGLLWRA